MTLMPIIMLSMGGLAVLAMIVLAFSGPSAERARARRLTALRERHSTSPLLATEAQLRRITGKNSSRADRAAMRFLPKPAELKKRLAMTGKSWTMGQYGAATLIIVLAVAAILLVARLPVTLSLLLAVALGAWLPHMVVGHLIKRRVKTFTAKFPDAIELLVRGLRSGLPVTETMSVVASEVPGAVGEEFRGVTDRMKIGRSMDAALQETAERIGTPEFQFFVITLAIQRETGGNLAETLQNLASVLRQRAQMKLKIRAMSSESKASAYIIGALPFIVFGMIWFINGPYMHGFFTDPRLMVVGGGGLVWMGIGAFIMAQMINFEI